MTDSPPHDFNATAGETDPLLSSLRSRSGSDTSTNPGLPIPESTALYGSSLASASASTSVNYVAHYPEPVSDHLFNPQSGRTAGTVYSKYGTGVSPTDTSQNTPGDYVHSKPRTRKPRGTEHFVAPSPPALPSVPGRLTSVIRDGEGHTNAVKEGHNPYCRVNTCLFIAITVGSIVSLLIPSIVMGTVVGIYKCQDSENAAVVYPDDTVLAATLTECQSNTTSVLERVGSPRNEIDVYVVPCDAVKLHTEEKNYTSITSPETHIGQTIIGLNSNNFSNYFGKNSSVSLTAQMSSNDSTEAFMCIYTNSSLFGDFLNPDSEEHFLQSMEVAHWCNKIQLELYTPYNYHTSFVFNNGYYFVGISPTYSNALSYLQFNLSVSRHFYNYSDFLENHITCPLSGRGSNCSAKNSYSSTCIMLHASVSIDSNYFNFIAINAEGFPVHHRPVFIYALAVSLCCGFAVMIIVVPMALCIYRRWRKQIN